jgi:hypothetical protein
MRETIVKRGDVLTITPSIRSQKTRSFYQGTFVNVIESLAAS